MLALFFRHAFALPLFFFLSPSCHFCSLDFFFLHFHSYDAVFAAFSFASCHAAFAIAPYMPLRRYDTLRCRCYMPTLRFDDAISAMATFFVIFIQIRLLLFAVTMHAARYAMLLALQRC